MIFFYSMALGRISKMGKSFVSSYDRATSWNPEPFARMSLISTLRCCGRSHRDLVSGMWGTFDPYRCFSWSSKWSCLARRSLSLLSQLSKAPAPLACSLREMPALPAQPAVEQGWTRALGTHAASQLVLPLVILAGLCSLHQAVLACAWWELQQLFISKVYWESCRDLNPVRFSPFSPKSIMTCC